MWSRRTWFKALAGAGAGLVAGKVSADTSPALPRVTERVPFKAPTRFRYLPFKHSMVPGRAPANLAERQVAVNFHDDVLYYADAKGVVQGMRLADLPKPIAEIFRRGFIN